MTPSPSSRARLLVLLAGLSAAGLAACAGSTAPTAPPASIAASSAASAPPAASPSEAAPPTPAASPSEAASATPAFTPVPADIDPCTLVTQAEASKLAGAQFPPGESSTTENHARLCAYSAQGTVVEVLVAVSPDAATAKAAEPDFKATLEQGVAEAGIANPKLTEMPGFEPGVDAAMVEGSASVAGRTVAGIALYALKGAVFVAISDVALGRPVATAGALQAQAHTTLSRLP